MARQNGAPIIYDQYYASEAFEHSTTRDRASGPALRTMDGVWDEGEADARVLSPRTTGNWAFTSVRRNGILPTSFGNDLLFERVWVEPVRVAAGFITEELTYEISIWNAYQDQTVEFTSISSVTADGTTLPTPTLPLDIAQSDDLVLTLTIDQTGAPIQETYWKPLIDGVTWSIYVTGIRVLGLAPGPTWEKGIQISYGFETVMYQTERFEEQRRPLLDVPYRILKATFPIYSRDAHKFFYEISYGHDKVFGVPIYNEMILSSVIPQGGTTITTVTPTDSLYNLNNLSSHIAIVDHGTGQVEIKGVDSITPSNTIEVTREIVDTFNVNSTRIYPVFFGLLSSVRSGHLTDDVEVIEIEFKEFNNG